MVPFPLNILLGIAVVAFMFWRLKNNFQAASDYVDAEEAKARKYKELLPKFKEDERYKKVKAYIDTKYKTTFDEPLDEETYKIDAIYFQVQKGVQSYCDTYDAEDPQALVFLLKSKKDRRYVSMDILSGVIVENTVGAFIYNSMMGALNNPIP